MLLYYITDRKALPGNEGEQRAGLRQKISQAASAGVDYIQLREKDLSIRELEALARDAISAIQSSGGKTSLLINSRADVAIAAGAAGVHLRSDDISPADVRPLWRETNPVIGISCHSVREVETATAFGATFAVLAPIFEKKDATGATPLGLDALRAASRASIPVLALGGVSLLNAQSCMEAGAAGIAGIRLFQQHDIAQIVRQLRS